MTHRAAGWKIRLRMAADDESIEAVFRDCLSDFPWRPSHDVELIRLRGTVSANHCLVAHESKAGIVGFLALERRKAYVSHLFVKHDWRFCGVGAGLLQVARDMARAPLVLDVDIQNEAAFKAYRAMGWTEKVGPKPGRDGQIRLSGP